MHLYQGTSEQFIADAVQARLANQLADRFFEEFRYRPGQSEVTSWRNSLAAMANVLQLADLRDQGVLVELKLPLSSKRLDVLITGSNPDTKRDSAVIAQLKQWTEVGRSNITDCVTVDYGGKPRDMLHPSLQGRALPALSPRHAPGILGRPGDRARRLRLPALRAARPDVAAVVQESADTRTEPARGHAAVVAVGRRRAHNHGGHVRRSGVAAMRRVAVTLALSLVVGGCGLLPQMPHDSSASGAMAHMSGDLGWENCPVELWITGVITPNNSGNAAIRDDQGVVHGLVWGTHNTAVVDWDRRYRIGGKWFSGVSTFWACGGADAVIPQ